MFRQRARRCGLRLEPQHPLGLSHYLTNTGPELRSRCYSLTGRGRQNPGLMQCSSPETLPHNFEEVVFAAWRKKNRAERMGDHIDAKQLGERQ